MRLVLLLIGLMSVLASKAAVVECPDSLSRPLRPVTAAYTLEMGSAHLVDTYLSQIRYNGWHGALGYERWQAMKRNPENLVMRLRVNLNLERATNQVGNATMWGLEADFQWSMMRRLRVAQGLTLGIGGGVSLDAGALYSKRNGNNPVSAKGALTLDLSGYGAYNFKIGRLPVTLCNTVDIPLAGAFFAPDYGELYYEIYLGDTSGLAHFAWPGNRFKLDDRLTADIHFGATSLRVGYHFGLFTSSINHITTRIITHSATVGISGEWISLDRHRSLRPATRIISALF